MKIYSNYRATLGIIIVALVFTSVRFAFESGVFHEQQFNPADDVLYIDSSIDYVLEEEEHFLLIAGESERVVSLTEEILYYQNKNYDVVTKSDDFILEDYDVVIVVDIDLSFIDSRFEEYVENGGGLLVVSEGLTAWNDDLFGLSKKGASQLHKGIRMLDDGLMMSDGMSYTGDYFTVFGSYFDFDDSYDIHMESINGMPLMFSREYGVGNFVMVNNSMVDRKSAMNIVSSALMLTKDTYIYPTYNAFQLHIDDWVSPIPNGDYEYGTGRITSLDEVYRQDWWPWIISLSKDLELEISMFIIGNYYDTTNGIGYNSELNSIYANSYYLLEAITLGYEVGVHGQNHQSLTVEEVSEELYGYNTWLDQTAMVNGINYVENSFHSEYPDYVLSSYVPPSNSMDEVGYAAVVEAMGDLKTIGSIFEDDNNELIYHQVYGIDEQDIAQFPRHTAGYIRTELLDWTALNGVTTTGVFAHFIHPDDLIDPARSYGLDITEMKESFESIIKSATNKYSFLNKSTLTEGYNQIVSHDNARITFDEDDLTVTIHIKDLYDGVGFFYRSKSSIDRVEGAEVYEVDSMTYFIVPTAADITVFK